MGVVEFGAFEESKINLFRYAGKCCGKFRIHNLNHKLFIFHSIPFDLVHSVSPLTDAIAIAIAITISLFIYEYVWLYPFEDKFEY